MKKLVFFFSLVLLFAAVATTNAQTMGAMQPTASGGITQIQGATTITSGLSIGAKGNTVVELQKLLIAKGYLKVVAPTGYFGNLTSQAVSAFQAANNLPQVGVVGPQTTSLLNQLLGGGTQQQVPSTNYVSSPEQPYSGNGGNLQSLPVGCTSSSGYSTVTGQPCSGTQVAPLPVGCSSASGYSTVTGLPCNGTIISSLPVGCTSSSGYSTVTGQPCSGTQVAPLPVGCSSASGYSTVTGQPCDGNSQVISQLPVGCTSSSGYSSFTGQPCDGAMISPLPVGCSSASGFSSVNGQPCGTQTVPQNNLSVITNPSISPSSVSGTTVILTGQLQGNWPAASGSWPTAWFYFSTSSTPSNGSSTPNLFGQNINSQELFSSASYSPTPTFLTNLTTGMTYYYQACGESSYGSQPVCGGVESLTIH